MAKALSVVKKLIGQKVQWKETKKESKKLYTGDRWCLCFKKVLFFLFIWKCLSNYTYSGQETILNIQAIDTKRVFSVGEVATQSLYCHMPRSLKERLSSKQRNMVWLDANTMALTIKKELMDHLEAKTDTMYKKKILSKSAHQITFSRLRQRFWK